ncbi:MAG: allophanate hydrolase [Hyphomicrobiaceae bacterium]
MISALPFDFASLRQAYRRGLSPCEVVDEVYRRIEAIDDPGIFLSLRPKAEALSEAERLGRPDDGRTLWGLPFCVKDNIDIGAMVTTAGCPAFAYDAETDAACVARLRAAGALLIGKTNLDQFATGLVGVRTPYPVPRNAVDPQIVPGGSSSGSAVAVSHGLVAFALGTDTAGSGRVPAALNNIVGLKPTLGAISATGVVPACRTLDTVSVFASAVDDAYETACAMAAYDATDAYSRHVPFAPIGLPPPHFRFAIPSIGSRRGDGDDLQVAMFGDAIAALEKLGGHAVEIDFEPLYAIAELLYAGSWVAERHAVIAELMDRDVTSIHPATRAVVEKAVGLSATDAFRDFYRLAELKRQVAPQLAQVDILCVPTVPRFVTVAEVEEDPLGPNTELGTYTNFVNLLDLCGLAVPTMPRSDGRPGSVTLLAPMGQDGLLASIGRALHCAPALDATPDQTSINIEQQPFIADHEIELAVVGAHMSGLPLNGDLTRLGARFVRTACTASDYRLYALADGPPARPGLVRSKQGAAIAIETWALPAAQFGAFITSVPQPLGIGTLTLATGEQVKGFICEAAGLDGATDITDYGGWRNYLSQKVAQKSD